MPLPPQVPVTSTKINDPILFRAPGATKEELYVMILVDQTNQVFKAKKIQNKQDTTLSPSAQVRIIPPPANGAKILSF